MHTRAETAKTFPQELQQYLQRLLDGAKGANPHRCAASAVDAMEVRTVVNVQKALSGHGVELTYGEACRLWESVGLDSQQSWVDADSIEDVWIELQTLCEHVRDGCDYAGISRPY